MAPLKNTSARKFKQRKNGNQSTREHLPFFRKVAKARQYTPACAAIYRLSHELLKISQTQATAIHYLRLLNDAGLPRLLVAEIVTAAALVRKGGAA
ncbi:hypothetical protein [Methylogaea oryzae]|uniref:hypothetical protein n=1 Tax=Methylogaea oryzae TaxID=1295382 RepID=UPI0012E1F0E6|nr:hypothetical protein [Methylogaea oryzae]